MSRSGSRRLRKYGDGSKLVGCRQCAEGGSERDSDERPSYGREAGAAAPAPARGERNTEDDPHHEPDSASDRGPAPSVLPDAELQALQIFRRKRPPATREFELEPRIVQADERAFGTFSGEGLDADPIARSKLRLRNLTERGARECEVYEQYGNETEHSDRRAS